MATAERRLEALEQAVPRRRYNDVRDPKDLSSLELALFLLDQLPDDYAQFVREFEADAEGDTQVRALLREHRTVVCQLGDMWAEAARLAAPLDCPFERYIALLFCTVLESGASPLLIERFRKGYPERIFAAVDEVGARTTKRLHAKR
jgi:hypothetical protein